ncbi:cohesin domain-containing protein [Patescibacteria group bacterium]|nr:cohesin domain-containing protein [Patescibacteria group bacterium]
MRKKQLAIIISLLIIFAIGAPLTLFILNKQQETRSRANASTSLSFTPVSTTSAPIRKNIGDTFSVDIMVNPGTNLISFVRFQIKYDPSKLALADINAFVPNTTAFPITIEGPITTSDTLAASVSIGSDPTKAIQTTTQLGTLNFNAIGATGNTPTQITYTGITQTLSAGSNEQAAENTLSTTTPAYIEINDVIYPTITVTPASTPSATMTPYPTTTSTTLKLNILLHGIGSAGDNPNPQGSSLSNKNPLHPQRNIDITIMDSTNQPVSSLAGSIIYNSGQGNFIGLIDLGSTFQTGNYTIKIKSGRYLRKLVTGMVNIKPLQENPIPQTALIAGDVKTDNILNVLDYNILLDCGYGAIDPLPLGDPNAGYNTSNCKSHEPFRINTDLDDNGIINSPDYNLFLRELSVQNGD